MILHTDITGQGEPLVLIHGLFGSYENLGVIARSLQDKFQIINLDLRNHGRSPHSEQMNYPLMAADVLETLDAQGLNQVSVLGHSMGGKVAMQLALQAPERVKKLILADISPVVNEPRHAGILRAMQQIDLTTLQDRREADQQLSATVTELGVRQFLLKNLVKEGNTFSWRLNLPALVANYPEILAAPQAKEPYLGPVLFIKGGDSDYLQPSHQDAIQQLFPHAKAKVIQGTGHWLHAEKPAAFSKIVADFLLS